MSGLNKMERDEKYIFWNYFHMGRITVIVLDVIYPKWTYLRYLDNKYCKLNCLNCFCKHQRNFQKLIEVCIQGYWTKLIQYQMIGIDDVIRLQQIASKFL